MHGRNQGRPCGAGSTWQADLRAGLFGNRDQHLGATGGAGRFVSSQIERGPEPPPARACHRQHRLFLSTTGRTGGHGECAAALRTPHLSPHRQLVEQDSMTTTRARALQQPGHVAPEREQIQQVWPRRLMPATVRPRWNLLSLLTSSGQDADTTHASVQPIIPEGRVHANCGSGPQAHVRRRQPVTMAPGDSGRPFPPIASMKAIRRGERFALGMPPEAQAPVMVGVLPGEARMPKSGVQVGRAVGPGLVRGAGTQRGRPVFRESGFSPRG
jgi:hypothetical protein